MIHLTASAMVALSQSLGQHKPIPDELTDAPRIEKLSVVCSDAPELGREEFHRIGLGPQTKFNTQFLVDFHVVLDNQRTVGRGNGISVVASEEPYNMPSRLPAESLKTIEELRRQPYFAGKDVNAMALMAQIVNSGLVQIPDYTKQGLVFS